jgi:WD40 repeat protein
MTFKGHSNDVEWVSFSPEGSVLVSAGADETLKLWDVSSSDDADGAREYVEFGETTSRPDRIAFSPDGDFLAVPVRETIELWDVRTRTRAQVLEGNGSGALGLAFSPDGATLAASEIDGTINLWNTKNGQLEKIATRRGKGVLSAGFLPSTKPRTSRWLPRALQASNLITTLDLETERILADCTVGDVEIRVLETSPNGCTFAAGDTRGCVSIWDSATYSELRRLNGHTHWVTCLSYTPDGNTIVSSGSDRTIILWDVRSGSRLRTLRGHTDQIVGLAVSTDGTTLASTGFDRRIKLWDLRTGLEQASFSLDDSVVTELVFSPDGFTLATAGPNQSIKLWQSRHVEYLSKGPPKKQSVEVSGSDDVPGE